MSEATRQSMLDRYGEDELTRLTDTQRVGAIDETRLSAALASANATVASYLAGGSYPFPLPAEDPAITDATCAIARYTLYRYDRPLTVTEDHDRAHDYLGKVAKGAVLLAVGIEPRGNVHAAEKQILFPNSLMDIYSHAGD